METEKIYKVPLISMNLLDAYLRKSFIPFPAYKIGLPHSLYSRKIFAINVDCDEPIAFSGRKTILVINPEYQIQSINMNMVAVKRNDGVLCIKRILVKNDSSYTLTNEYGFGAHDFNMQSETYEIIGEIITIIFPD